MTYDVTYELLCGLYYKAACRLKESMNIIFNNNCHTYFKCTGAHPIVIQKTNQFVVYFFRSLQVSFMSWKCLKAFF